MWCLLYRHRRKNLFYLYGNCHSFASCIVIAFCCCGDLCIGGLVSHSAFCFGSKGECLVTEFLGNSIFAVLNRNGDSLSLYFHQSCCCVINCLNCCCVVRRFYCFGCCDGVVQSCDVGFGRLLPEGLLQHPGIP